ncbi:MAG: hypothetical protein PHS77_12820 [Gallionellaceae bacterium]|nr:hypothetical protein [Gallionellaceae bacterium]
MKYRYLPSCLTLCAGLCLGVDGVQAGAPFGGGGVADVRTCGPVQQTLLQTDVDPNRPDRAAFPDLAGAERVSENRSAMGYRHVRYRLSPDVSAIEMYKTINRSEYLDQVRYLDKDNKDHGATLYFNRDSGAIDRVYEFRHGKKHGLTRFWSHDGQLINLERVVDGVTRHHLVWRVDGKTRYLERESLADGDLLVEKRFYPDGRLQQLTIKGPDYRHQVLECSRAGLPEQAGQTRLGLNVGEWTWYKPDGSPRLRRVYDDDGVLLREQVF